MKERTHSQGQSTAWTGRSFTHLEGITYRMDTACPRAE
jgi:hypothetical protein